MKSSQSRKKVISSRLRDLYVRTSAAAQGLVDVKAIVHCKNADLMNV
jgi:hypothetical protein